MSTPAAGTRARLEGLPAGPLTLPIVPSGSGRKYSDGTTTYWSRGTESTLEIAGQSRRACVVIADPGTLPGSRWRLVRIESMDGTQAVPDSRSRYTLEFGAPGALAGRADCDRLSGRGTASASHCRSGRSRRPAQCVPRLPRRRYVRSLEAAARGWWSAVALAIAMKLDARLLHFEPVP